MKRFIHPYICFIVITTSSVVHGEALKSNNARKLFDNSANATRNLNYAGNFIYDHDQKLESIKIVHFQTNGVEQEVLRSRDGNPWEIVSIGDQVFVDFGANKQTDVRYNRVKNFSTQLSDDIFKYYTFSIMGEERVAERLAKKVEIKPTDDFRYGYRIWIDNKTNLILKTQVLSSQGLPIEVMMFTELNLDIKPPKNLVPFKKQQQSNVVPKNTSQNIKFRTKLPPGFIVKDNVSMEGMYEQMIYTDGIANISIFISRQKAAVVGSNRPQRFGSTTAMGLGRSSRQVTIIGEVPLRTVEQIAESIRLNIDE